MKNTKKAVIVKLLLVYLKVTLRQLHNTLLASYGGPALSLSKGSTGFTSFFIICFWNSVIISSSTSCILFVYVFGEPKGFMPCGQDDPRALPEQSEAKAWLLCVRFYIYGCIPFFFFISVMNSSTFLNFPFLGS